MGRITRSTPSSLLRIGFPAPLRAPARTAAEAGKAAGRRLRPDGSAQRVVRYVHAEDATAAARLAGRLGRGWAIQDFRAYHPSPTPQTIEVWMPER